jgi:hypothetical protein
MDLIGMLAETFVYWLQSLAGLVKIITGLAAELKLQLRKLA